MNGSLGASLEGLDMDTSGLTFQSLDGPQPWPNHEQPSASLGNGQESLPLESWWLEQLGESSSPLLSTSSAHSSPGNNMVLSVEESGNVPELQFSSFLPQPTAEHRERPRAERKATKRRRKEVPQEKTDSEDSPKELSWTACRRCDCAPLIALQTPG